MRDQGRSNFSNCQANGHRAHGRPTPGHRAHSRGGHRRPGGFTLVEVLATLLLMGIVLPVISRGISVYTAAADESRNRAIAGALAESKLNTLVVGGNLSLGTTSDKFGNDYPGFSWQAVVTNYGSALGASGSNTPQQLDVTVSWIGRNGPDSITLTTLAYASPNAQNPVNDTPSAISAGGGVQ